MRGSWRITWPASWRELAARWGLLAIMLAATVAIYATGADRYVSLQELRAHQQALQAFVAAHYFLSLAAYLAIYTLATAVAFPGAVFLQLAAGLLVGTAVGGGLTALGATLGALATYYAARTAFGDALRARAAEAGGVTARWRAGMEKHAFWYLLSLRLPPFMPFVLVNAVAGCAAVSVRAYSFATFLGVLPSSLIYASIGSGLSRAFARHTAFSLFEPGLLLPLVALSLLSLIPVAVRLVRRPAAA